MFGCYMWLIYPKCNIMNPTKRLSVDLLTLDQTQNID
jgi:hypothetical protein